jgi:hypothetical protein
VENGQNMIIGYRKALNNWLRQFRTFIDLDHKLYKIEESLLNIFKWGKFVPLPQLNYVLVFRSFYAKCEACSLDENADSYYQISLVHNKNRKIIMHETKNKSEALTFAGKLAKGLDLSIKDAASVPGQSSWKKI